MISQKGNRGGVSDTKAIISSCFYFHGYLTRDITECLLEKEGDFLVMEEIKDDIPVTVVAVYKGGSAGNIAYFRLRLGSDGRMYTEAEIGFSTTENLITHYFNSGKPLAKGSEVHLKRPIPIQNWQIFPTELINDEDTVTLGSGAFGKVTKMKYKREQAKGGTEAEPVAVKDCFVSSASERESFMREFWLTVKCQCPYVVRMYGMATLSPPIQMVMEFLPLGDLCSYLKTRNTSALRPPLWQLVKFCLDTAKGLEFVSKQSVIHLDIATRNCLIKEEENQTKNGLRAVMADFGLSRESVEYKIVEDDKISQRWAAPELQSPPPTATTKSDVWSYGIMLWEIFSDASLPYPEFENTQALLMRLEEGHRMTPPKNMPKEITDMMNLTWKWKPKDRPSFADCTAKLQAVYAATPKVNTPLTSAHRTGNKKK